jgi:glycosyltransferase involved in cell wall biosynthesis
VKSLNRPLNIFVPHCSDLLTDHRPHGDGLVAHGFIRRLAERGHALHVAVSEVDLKSPLPGNVCLHKIKSGRETLWSRFDYIRQVRKLFFHLRQNIAFDLIHQLNPVYTGISLGLSGCLTPIVLGPYIGDWPDDPFSITSHKWVVRAPLESVKRTIAAAQQHFAHSLLLTTPAAASRIEHRSTFCRMELLPHGIDSDLFRPKKSGAAPSRTSAQDSTEILFMAWVERRKGIFDLLQAFDYVAVRFPGTRLAIAGDGSDLLAAQRTASRSPAFQRISFLGRQDRAGAVALLQNTDIYCLPSHGEPYGMTAVEAMSCGKPLVVTNAGGLGCLVDDQGGLRVPVGNTQALADALCALIADPGRRKHMGEHNRRRVLRTMAWDRVIDRLEEIYIATLERNHRARRKRQTRTTVLAQSLGTVHSGKENYVSAD